MLHNWGYTRLAKKERKESNRGDASRGQADRPHHLPGGLSRPPARRAVDDRAEYQGSAGVRPQELIGADLASGKVALAHPARRPTRRHFVLLAEARHARDRDLRALADWLETYLTAARRGS
jgi:hypothetical protein